MADTDVELTFDAKMMEASLKKIVDSLGVLEAKLGQTADSTTKMEKKGAKSIGIWTNLIHEGIQLVKSGINKMLSFMPEVGKTFSIAGEIIGRNLLWPLRQELIPLLQKFLNWTRDHRAMFVRWGGVIRNVFRILMSIVTSFFNMFRRIMESVSVGLRKIFGNTAQSITEIMNVLLFKIAVISTFIQALLEPVFDIIVTGFLRLVTYAKAFWDGLVGGARGLPDAFDQLVEILGELGAMFKEQDSLLGPFIGALKILGSIVSSVVVVAFNVLLEVVDDISMVMAGLIGMAKVVSGSITAEEFAKQDEERRKRWEDRRSRRVGNVKENVVGTVGYIGDVLTGEDGKEEAAPVESVKKGTKSSAPAKSGDLIVNGGIHVSSPNADPRKVAELVPQAIKRETAARGQHVPQTARN